MNQDTPTSTPLEQSSTGTLVCDNCFGQLVDQIFLGNIIRPLFLKGDSDQIKDGLINFVTSAGVVSALMISISTGQAFSVQAYDWMSTINVICWYLATWMSMWSVVVSTILGVLLSITPRSNLRKVGQKLLYVWVVPAWLMLWSSFCIVSAIWSQAEMGFRLSMAANSTRVQSQEILIVWVTRCCYIVTVTLTGVSFLTVMCCSAQLDTYFGIESVHVRATKGTRKGGEEKKEKNVINPINIGLVGMRKNEEE